MYKCQYGNDPMDKIYITDTSTNELTVMTRFRLNETFLIMGCKTRTATLLTERVFEFFHQHNKKNLLSDQLHHFIRETLIELEHVHSLETVNGTNIKQNERTTKLEQKRSPNKRKNCRTSSLLLEFRLANEITMRKRHFIVLLGGTSGTGKSTLASLLATRLRLATVLPTDSIRQSLRTEKFPREDFPYLYASTYQAGEYLPKDHVLVQEEEEQQGLDACLNSCKCLKKRKRKKALAGYALQSDLVLTKLDQILTSFEQRNESIVVEGVHLNMKQMVSLVSRHPTCIPFFIYISNQKKHRERFAVRARYMTLDPHTNKYIKFFDHIQWIQRFLCKNAELSLVPKIDNTNVDRSVASIQSTILRVLSLNNCQKESTVVPLVDPKVGKLVVLSREHEKSIQKAWSSKVMQKALRPYTKQKVSKRLLLRRLLAEQKEKDAAEEMVETQEEQYKKAKSTIISNSSPPKIRSISSELAHEIEEMSSSSSSSEHMDSSSSEDDVVIPEEQKQRRFLRDLKIKEEEDDDTNTCVGSLISTNTTVSPKQRRSNNISLKMNAPNFRRQNNEKNLSNNISSSFSNHHQVLTARESDEDDEKSRRLIEEKKQEWKSKEREKIESRVTCSKIGVEFSELENGSVQLPEADIDHESWSVPSPTHLRDENIDIDLLDVVSNCSTCSK